MNQKHSKKGLEERGIKRLHPKAIGDKDETLLNELKRIKRLQKGLYKEYEADELDGIDDD
jgi:hypothetical protein